MTWRDQFHAAFFWLLIGLAIVLTAGSLCSGAELFDWADPAPHHDSAVLVRGTVPGRDGAIPGGSGVYVRLSESASGVLTCEHVVHNQPEARVQWSDGSWGSGAVLTDKTEADAAFISVLHATILPLAIAANPPAAGERVEYIGFGGPAGRTIRPHWGTVLGYSGQDVRTTAPVISGDSGGCILNEAHEVVGLSAYGVSTIARIAGDGGPWNVYRPSGGPGQPVLKAFVDRVATRMQCGPAGCAPGGSCGPQRPGSSGGGSLYPPQTPYQRPDAAPPAPLKPPPPPMVDIDYNKLLELAAKDGRFRGEQGPAGKDGKDGAPGPAGKGEPGAAGPPGPAGPPPSSEEISAAVAQWIRDNPGEVAAIVAPHLPGIWFRRVDASTGTELSPPEEVRLGDEGFTFYITPHTTPHK